MLGLGGRVQTCVCVCVCVVGLVGGFHRGLRGAGRTAVYLNYDHECVSLLVCLCACLCACVCVCVCVCECMLFLITLPQ